MGREICGKASWLQITRDIGMLLLNYCKFVALSIKLGTSTNGTLGSFFYHLFSVIYASLFFALTFELARKNIPVFENDSQRLSGSCFNLLLIYGIVCTHVNTNLHKYQNSDSSKDRRDTKNTESIFQTFR